MSPAAALARSADAVPPLTPDGDEAREWAKRELADPVYDIAEPTPFDRIARAIGDFIQSILSPDVSGGWASAFAVVAAVVVVVVIVAAFLVWGMPRASRRAARASPVILGEAEVRSAAQLRAEAERHARAGEWDAAVVLRFRSLVRGCLERGVVDTPPGATVHAFARAASRAFPDLADELEAAAVAFDDVRYLRRPGTAETYRLVAATEDAVTRARPGRKAAPVPAVPA